MTDYSQQTQAVLDLTLALMRAPSVTPADEGCQQLLAAHLQRLGYNIEFINAGGVTNLWASKHYGEGPHLLFAGHTDVVPPGPLNAWQSPPFEPDIREGHLYGRGAADMKSSLAAMLVAVQTLHQQHEARGLAGTVSFLITSDEEGPAIHGTAYVIEKLLERNIYPDFCVVGEPSSTQILGDVVRVGRRGSLNATLTVNGIQGHVAYPDEADNPIHRAMAALDDLTRQHWDAGNQFYPPTSLQISNINGGTGATNVIPGALQVMFNFRFNTEHSAPELQAQVEQLLARHGLDYHIDWQLSGNPFLTQPGRLTAAVTDAIQTISKVTPELSTSGGTSDGRFISPWSAGHQVEVVEVGPINATIHKVNECVSVADLAPLAAIYHHIAAQLLEASS